MLIKLFKYFFTETEDHRWDNGTSWTKKLAGRGFTDQEQFEIGFGYEMQFTEPLISDAMFDKMVHHPGVALILDNNYSDFFSVI
jgi:hypothetical protein